jgi:2-desacetyl-2-hydroxyethyl bacteriochlorophyllide A dehydrogenase
MMHAAVFESPGILRLTEVPQPIPASGETRLTVLLAGICATDVYILHGRFPVKPPRILGHEVMGRVNAIGSQVSEEWLGKVCGVRPARFCGACPPCRKGFPELCLNFQCIGNTQDGGFAQEVVVQADQLVFLPEVKPERLVWLEPLACVIHALQTCHIEESEVALIIGAGTLGRLMVQTLRATSMVHIGVVDPNPAKIEQALACGAENGWVIPRSGNTTDIDKKIRAWSTDDLSVVIDTSGSPAAITRALHWAGPAGRVLIFGVSDPAAELAVRPELIFSKELTIRAAAGMTPASFEAAIDLLRSSIVDPTGLVSAIIHLAEAPKVIKDGSLLKMGKVIIQPNGDSL